jgi:hypothetical protein
MIKSREQSSQNADRCGDNCTGEQRRSAGTATSGSGCDLRRTYESPSQFSREYRRHFGEPPARDIVRLRASPGLAVVA